MALAAGGSPLVLAAAFLGLLALWGGFAILGAPLPPPGLVRVMGAPPAHVPLDLELIPFLLRTSSGLALAAVVALGAVRGLILGSVVLFLHDAVRENADPRAALRRLPRVAVSVFGIYGVEVALFLFLSIFVQSILGPSAGLVMLVLGLHFLAFAPVVAAAEGVPAGAALRIGMRAARLPGARHLSLVLLYVVVLLYAELGAAAVGGEPAPATPSILTWGVALLATVGHVVMMGALAYRWDVVRDHVLAEERRREAERRAARGRGRGGRPAPARRGSTRKSSSKAVADPGKPKTAGTKAGKGGPKARGSRRGKRR